MHRNDNNFFIRRILAFLWSGLMITATCAGTPLWTFEPLTATTVAVPANGIAMVQYRITNQSSRPHTLAMLPIQGVTQITTGLGVCNNFFMLEHSSSCILSLQINGSQLSSPIVDGPVVCQQGNLNQCYRPRINNILYITQAPPVTTVTLTTIAPNSGTASGETGVTLTGTGLTGATTVTFGGIPATSVHVVNSTTVTAVTPAHLTGVVDVVINTPAGDAILINGYTYLSTTVGQPSGGGIIACLNGGLNDLIAATADNSTGIAWGGSGTTIGVNAQSTTDGASNTQAIVNELTGIQGISINSYAAGLCSNYEVDSQGNNPCQVGNTCYNDWFLPAGHNLTLTGQLNCIYNNRELIGGFVSNIYWSSTEASSTNAWVQSFPSGIQTGIVTKNSTGVRVRCVRTFTPLL